MMTLDEAIQHAEETSAKDICPACAQDHRQLALWLKELRERRKDAKKYLPDVTLGSLDKVPE